MNGDFTSDSCETQKESKSWPPRTLTSTFHNLCELALTLHGCFLLDVAMIRDVRYVLCVLLDSECLWIVGHLGQFSFRLLKVRVIIYI